MENFSVWKWIKIGFWLGIGFILPQMFVLYAGTVGTYMALPSVIENTWDADSASNYSEQFDRAASIKIENFRDESDGTRLLILGRIVNVGDSKARSIQLEAELFNQAGEFVYECSEYISKDLASQEAENFQIKCGCGNSPIPPYKEVTVRVVGASAF